MTDRRSIPIATFKNFVKLGSIGGILLFIAAIAAMVLKNSPIADWYSHLLTLPVQIRVGELDLNKPLVLWVNDGLMAIFFLLVSLEIKREMLVGHLSKLSSIVLPGIAAIGGIILPALIFITLNYKNPDNLHGWAIPTTTDIAFALGVLALLGSRVPVSLKIFLMTLAVLDDLAAIVIIALFYSGNLSWASLVVALITTVALFTLNSFNVKRIAPYILLGIILWVSVLKSGVHATLAGVILAFAIPLGDPNSDHASPMKRLIHDLHPWVAFGILPLFAFMNAGIAFSDFNPNKLFNSVPVGIALGLLIGKPLGVLLFSWLTIKIRLASLPERANWLQFIGVAFLCGIGFTMSLFIGSLAFQQGAAGYARADRLGIIVGSLLAGIIGYILLRISSRSPEHQSPS